MAESNCKAIQLEEEVEGDIIETTDFFFDRIGGSVPLTSHEDFQFDLQNPPSRPLAVSERFQLIFVAHSSGFWVARTNDVVESANAFKAKKDASSIQELSVVDVQIGKVHILALSADSETLAASVGGDIHFFSVKALLSKEQKPSYSCSLNDSTYVKDVQWIKKLENTFVVRSSQGRLYHGVLGYPLKNVMDNVDAIEWSVKGNLVAVARKNILSIFSSTFKERLRMPLSFKSWVGVSDVNCIIQVDSIKWVRPDCIILGCLQLTTDGMEENYMVQVITTKSGKFTDDSSEPVVLSFCDLFPGLNDDIVPSGSGPHLFLSYLEQCELAIAVNRKNTDQHIVLIGWSKGDENSKAAVIDIDRDKWLPRIELQENGDDNLVMGLSVDNTSVYGKVQIQLGVDEQRELPPYCVIFCLTLEGKLIMYHVASVAETAVQTPVDSVFPDEEDENVIPSVVWLEDDVSKVSSGSGGERSEDVVVDFQLHDLNKKELRMEGTNEISNKNDLKSFDRNISSSPKAIFTGRQEVKELVNFQKYEAEEKKKAPKLGQYQETIGQQLRLSGSQSTGLEQLDLKTFQLEGASNFVRDLSKEETQRIAEVGYSTRSFVGKSRSDMSHQLNKDSQKGIEVGKELPGKIGLTGLQTGSSQEWSIGKSVSLKDSNARYPLPSSSSSEGHKLINGGLSVGLAKTHGDFSGSPSYSKVIIQSSLVNASTGPTQNGGQIASTRMGNIEPLPSIRNSSQFKSQDEKLPNYKLPATTEKYRSPSLSGQLSAEPKLSKQFGNIKDMTKELDALLKCIEETGGFRDASTVAHKDSLLSLEQGMVTLSEKCRKCKSMLDEQYKDVQNLLDKTVQVLARKIHIEGILKQATDSRYWDVWNRQKLSSELELKRRHLVEINQDLTSQLIELERHFNTLELNKFGDDGGSYLGKKSQSRFGPSRHIQSLHSLHNTMSSQLAVAEQLSECLLKQMTVLSIESPERRQNVRKELFETIGIPYDGASFSSPDATKANDTSSIKKLSSSSKSIANKDQSRRKQSSLMKNYEPETARRRRDSLDRSWASFEPPKTTVKRLVVQEIQKVKANKSLLSMDKQLRPHVLEVEGSVATHPNNRTTPSTFLYPSGNKGIQGLVPKQASESSPTSLFKWANDLPAPSQSVGTKSPTLQRNHFQALSSQSAFQSSPILGRSSVRDSGDFPYERPASDASITEKSDSALVNETNSNLHSETGLIGAPSLPMKLPSQTHFTLNKSTLMSNSNSKETLPTATSGNQKQLPLTTKSLSFESGKNHNSPFSRTSSTPPAPKFSERDFQFDYATSKSQPGEQVLPSFTSSVSLSTPSISPLTSASSAPQYSLPSMSSTAPASSAAMPLNRSFPIAKATIDANQTVSSISTSSSSPIHSSGSFSFQAYETVAPSYPSPSLTSASQSPHTEVQHSVEKFSLKTDTIAAEPAPSLQAQPSTGEFCLKLEPSVSSAPAIEVSTGLASGNQSSLSNITSPASSAVLNSQPEQLSSTTVVFQAAFSTSASATAGKIDTPNNAVTQEDEMEEEASETSHTAELSLGSLGGFGLGSAPNSAVPRANPFGGPFANTAVNAGSSSFTLTNPTGELFRPASLSFQSPQPSHPSSPFSGGFGTGTPVQAPTGSGFGQPSQIGPGQQALGSVLGGFGQSRQLGAGLPVTGFSSVSSFGSGFTGTQPTGGFANAATGGGFAGAASGGGGFAALASGGGGFASMASAGSGFSGVASAAPGFSGVAAGGGFGGGGFSGAASGTGFPTAGGGFGAFSNQQGSGGFSGFGSPGTVKPSSELFTQMRK